MPAKMWLPFRGDNYSKENSRKYIPGAASIRTRLFVTFIVIPIAAFVVIRSINNLFAGQEGLPIFWLLMAGIVLSMIYFAARDARRINSKEKDFPDNEQFR